MKLTVTIPNNYLGRRLDKALSKLFYKYSRSQIKKWILNKYVLVNGNIWNTPKKKVSGGELVTINASLEEDTRFNPKNIVLDIIYEDDDIIIINKPCNLVVHPGAGNNNNTILNALLYYYPPIVNVPRAGIVHRLDKDTTGLMVVAKNVCVWTRLIKAFQVSKIIREYEAIAIGKIINNGTIIQPIGRHPIRRVKMSVHPMGKPAVTHYNVIEHFKSHTLLRLRLETGRTHQIRVHMAHISHHLVGDQLYGKRCLNMSGMSSRLTSVLRKFNRQALHAVKLRLCHPINGVTMEWHAPTPQDMKELIEELRIDLKKYNNNIE